MHVRSYVLICDGRVVWCGVVWCGVVWCQVVWCVVYMLFTVFHCVMAIT